VSRQIAIALALIVAAAVLVAVMMWSTAARGQMPERPDGVVALRG